MQTIQLTKGFVALVDDADYLAVSAHKWGAMPTPHTVYAYRKTSRKDGKQKTQYLHRFILGLTDRKMQADHRDHNGLNCQRHNLRVCTNQQNHGNIRKFGKTSQYKGVCRHRSRWIAQISVNMRTVHLGSFHSELDAALTYDAAARQHFGEFALTNFPPKKPCVSSAPALDFSAGANIS